MKMKKLYVSISEELYEQAELCATTNDGGDIRRFIERAIKEAIARDEERKNIARELLCALEDESTPSCSSAQWLFDDEKQQ